MFQLIRQRTVCNAYYVVHKYYAPKSKKPIIPFAPKPYRETDSKANVTNAT